MTVTVRTSAGLEHVLGDPFEAGPAGFDTVLAADAGCHLPDEAEHRLLAWGANAELVPTRLGGRWTSTRDLVDRLMPVFRRDAALGLGFGVTSLMAGVNVWIAGDEQQQQDVADVLLRGGRVSIMFHELEHGNDLTANACRLEDTPTGLRLTGTKAVVNNVDRADLAVLMARTATQEGPRSHTLVLWDPTTTEGVRAHARYRTAGMRGVRLGGVDLRGAPVHAGALLGGAGTAVEVALRAFQVTRSVLPALAVGSLDGALHVAGEYAAGRSLYGTTVLELPYTHRLVAVALGDLLLADALASTAVRALHVAPQECFLLSAACKYLVPELLQDGLDALATLLGSTFYAKVAPYGIVEKHVRDLAVLPIGHAGGMSCLMSILPHLPRWSRPRDVEPVPGLFDDDAVTGEPDLTRLTLAVGGRDAVTSVLTRPDVVRAVEAVDPRVGALVRAHAARLTTLVEQIRAASRSAFTGFAEGAVVELARDLTILLAAAAAVGTWHASYRQGDPRDGAAWLSLTLARSGALLGVTGHDPTPHDRAYAVDTLQRRRAERRSMRLTAEPIFFRPPSTPEETS